MHGRMALPKEISFVTFDVYGTLIDWETGAYDAFVKEAEKDGYTLSREELVPLFLEIQQEIKGGSYELYAEVLRRTAVQISRQLGWPLEPSRSGFLPDSVKRWPPFKETNTQLDRFKKKFEIGLIANVDDKLLGETRRHFKSDFDLVVTAQQVRSYKPDAAHFKENWDLDHVPGFNFNQEQSHASMNKLKALAEKEHAEVWINHEKTISDKIPKRTPIE